MSNYNKLKELCEQIDSLICARVSSSSPAFKDWKAKVKLQLAKFGEESVQYKSWSKIHFSPVAYYDNTDYIKPCREGLESAKSLLEAILEDMEETEMNTSEKVIMDSNSVFIVHGHDEALKYKVSNLLRKIGLNPIILHEQTNSCITIIEKIEKHGAEAGAAIILFTPDDTGKANKETDYRNRARQNVVFEAGFFIGLLGREKTMIIKSDDSVELPGDLSGVVYADDNEFAIARELRNMGFDVDMNKI